MNEKEMDWLDRHWFGFCVTITIIPQIIGILQFYLKG